MSGPEDRTMSQDPAAHAVDVREQGFLSQQLTDRHRMHEGEGLGQGGPSPVPETFSQDPNAHSAD